MDPPCTVSSTLSFPKEGSPSYTYDHLSLHNINKENNTASYIHSSYQKRNSEIIFRVPRVNAWNDEGDMHSGYAKRQSDLYVFCLLKNNKPNRVDPMNVDQWEFYVIQTELIDKYLGDRDLITLSMLRT